MSDDRGSRGAGDGGTWRFRVDRVVLDAPVARSASEARLRRDVRSELERQLSRPEVLDGFESGSRDRVRVDAEGLGDADAAGLARLIVEALRGAGTEGGR